MRPLGDDTARLTLHRPLPLRAGDRALLRDPGAQAVAAGVLVLDTDPPVLRRRGAAASRGEVLTGADGTLDLVAELVRRGAARRADLVALGVELGDLSEVRVEGDWLVDPRQWRTWAEQLSAAVDVHAVAAPLEAGLPAEAARQALGLPDPRLLPGLVAAAQLESAAGRVRRRGSGVDLGPAEVGVAELEQRLRQEPFSAADAPELDALRLGARELAAEERAGRLLRVSGDVVLLPDGPARAMRVLAALPQPFTLSAARQALGTTRRVAVPLLEHLDGRGWTRRLDGNLREVRRGG
jgi:selenocysteine-specific elongation factor